ncbi:MAG: PQQ-like beta-propeller repeat protein [Spirochaetes bacterium]|nr:PQQ-like beta-propeller repeat protein [Spirochaetota bacterium]
MDGNDKKIILEVIHNNKRFRAIDVRKLESLIDRYNFWCKPFDYDSMLASIKNDVSTYSFRSHNVISLIAKYAYVGVACAIVAIATIFGGVYYIKSTFQDYPISQNVVTSQNGEMYTWESMKKNALHQKRYSRQEMEKWALSKNAALVAYIKTKDSKNYIITIGKRGIIDAMSDEGKTWSYELGSSVTAPIAWSNEAIYCASADSKITAVSLNAGKQLWSKEVEGRLLFGGGMVYSEGRIYAGTANGYLYSFNSISGDVYWIKKFTTGIFVPPIVVNADIVVATNDGNLIQMRTHSGAIVHSIAIGRVTGMTHAERRLYISTENGNFICYDYEKKRERWRYGLHTRLAHAPLVERDRVFAFSSSGHVFCFNREGQMIWRTELGGIINFRPAFWRDGLYILAGQALYVLDLSDGSIKWSYVMDSIATTSATIADNAIIYGTESKGLVILPLN